MRRTIGTLCTLAWLAIAAPADAGPGFGPRGHGFGPEGGGPPPPGALVDLHADELGLGEDTRQAIRAILESSHEEGRALNREVREARHRLHELLEAEPVDRDAVMDQVEVVGELEMQAEKHRIESMLAIRDQLTPEQRAQLVELRGRMVEHHFQPIFDACGAEIESLCGGRGPGAIPCLVGSRESLEGACAEAVDGLPEGFAKGGKYRRGPGAWCGAHGGGPRE
ncbi:MAG TPA: Spy/CpxP family protein refolding chaperone [Myxococcota bacterium]|nr:Spy/CpxP family protein refolding chaperone [Myxococcota bacterium]